MQDCGRSVLYFRFAGHHRQYRLHCLFRAHPHRACVSPYHRPREWTSIHVQIFFPRSVEGEMTLREQQRARRRHRAQRNVSRSKGVYAIPGSEDPSFLNISPSKTDLDQLDPPNASLNSAGLPAYDAAAPRGLDRLPSKKAMLEDSDPLDGSFWLQPNRLNRAGDVELGTVLTDGEVELVRARSTRVNSLVHHWRSPIGACVVLLEWCADVERSL